MEVINLSNYRVESGHLYDKIPL